jgi:hypothetical protein
MKPPLGVSEEEDAPPTSPQWSCQIKPPLGVREEEQCGGD